MDDQRYHDEEPAGEGHEPKTPENWNWIVPGSTPSPRRGCAPKAEDASRWDVLPESPSRTSQWPTHTDTGTTGTSGREWWAEADPEPFAFRSARRLSPRSMVVGPINQLRGLLLPIVVGLFIGGFNPWLLAATAVAIISLLIGGFVTWQTLRYEITEDRIEIRRGLVRRERRTIPLERVRGVDVTST
ncbi:MAG TPA: PH domain-containing protein, partial [Candidatus Nocardiopsis merdipullorum]|nr:PH domain-containing protein [Candidatus Nocardiopsis merdipullorum]